MKSITLLLVVVFVLGVRATTAQVCTTTTDDALITAAINDAAAAGGGTVELEARVYDICDPVVLKNGVHLRGAGRGATVLRTRQGLASGSLGSSVIGQAVNNASVTDLTLDHRTGGRAGNGIAFIDDPITGNVSTNILIARNEVLGAPGGYHQYLIWNYRGRYVKILNNWVDGAFSGSTWVGQEEGIESFGGYDILIQGNSVKNIDGGCLSVGSPDGSPSDGELVGVILAQNFAVSCFNGINVGSGTNPPFPVAHVIVRDNFVIYAANIGIAVSVGQDTVIRDLKIAGNTVRNVGAPAGRSFQNVAGIRLFMRSGTAEIESTTVSGNHVDNVRGSPGVGIRLDGYSNARIRENTVNRTSDGGIAIWGDSVSASDDVEVAGNRIEAASTYGIFAGTLNRRLVVTGNRVSNWGVTEAIHIEGAQYGIVRDNMFTRTDSARPSPLFVGNGSCGVSVTDNIALYRSSVANSSSPPCP